MAKAIIVIDDEAQHTGAQLRKVHRTLRNVDDLTVTYVTGPVKSWANMKGLFAEYSTALSDYLFDEVHRASQQEQYYKKRAAISLKVSDELKIENGLLKERIKRLERKIEKAEADQQA